jgi:type IV pilus assembly protein PilN
MRFNINLASQPYEAARQFRRRIVAAVAVLAVVTAALLGYIIYQRIQSRAINQQLAQVQAEIDGLDREEAQARAILNRPANREVADQSEFLNQLFARKALSWTRVFGQMEKIMPPNLHVVSIKPEYTKSGDLMLHMVVATDSRDRAVELVRRMEKSNHFRQPQVVAESVTTNSGSDTAAGPGNIQFEIAAIYVPTLTDEETTGEPDNDKKDEENATPKRSQSTSVIPPGASPVQAQNQPPRRERQH